MANDFLRLYEDYYDDIYRMYTVKPATHGTQMTLSAMFF